MNTGPGIKTEFEPLRNRNRSFGRKKPDPKPTKYPDPQPWSHFVRSLKSFDVTNKSPLWKKRKWNQMNENYRDKNTIELYSKIKPVS